MTRALVAVAAAWIGVKVMASGGVAAEAWSNSTRGPPDSSPYKQSSWTQRCRPESDGDESDAIPFQTRAGEADPGRISSQRDVMTPEAEGSPGRNTT